VTKPKAVRKMTSWMTWVPTSMRPTILLEAKEAEAVLASSGVGEAVTEDEDPLPP
jgi:hypothetical protein